MNTTNTAHSTDVQEPTSKTQRHEDTYRAPSLVRLGSAVGPVQGANTQNYIDGQGGYTWR